MKVHEFLFEVARETTNVNDIEIARLKEKANNDVKDYTPEMGGFKGMYAKLNAGWILPLILMISLPFAIAYITKLKNKILNNDSELDYEDEHETPKFL